MTATKAPALERTSEIHAARRTVRDRHVDLGTVDSVAVDSTGPRVDDLDATDVLIADVIGAAALGILLALVAWALPSGAMAPSFWAGAIAIALLSGGVLAHTPLAPNRARGWLELGVASIWFAAIAFGANGALDALNGPRASPLDSGGSLGGFELAYALCPGLTAIALAGWLRRCWLDRATTTRRHAGADQGCPP